MRRTELLQEIRKLRFKEVYTGWTEKRLTQEEAAQILGVCDRTFRRYICHYKEDGEEGLNDKRITQASLRRAPIDEITGLKDLYRSKYQGWNVKHFYSRYKRKGGQRSYTWVKNELQKASLVKKSSKRGVHRKRREPMPMPGMMIHQDGSTHEWVPGKKWDLIVTMDDATNEHYSMLFVKEEGTTSSFLGIKEVINKQGLFSSFYSDRGSHYWYTPESGGKVDKNRPTQFGRALQLLGISMIAAYSPEARGRSERAFRTHQDRLPKELLLHGITSMEEANQYLATTYRPEFNEEFRQAAKEPGTAFVPWIGKNLDDILCERYERTVTADNCVNFEGLTLQIPADRYRCHYVRVKVWVHKYNDGRMAIFHGPRKLSLYDAEGNVQELDCQQTAA